MGLSFNAKFGLILGILVIASMYIGVKFDSEGAFIIGGYLSIFAGLVMLIWTIATNAYIGTVMAPLMWLSMILLVVIGVFLVYPPANDIIKLVYF